jgi:hypothetical protein
MSTRLSATASRQPYGHLDVAKSAAERVWEADQRVSNIMSLDIEDLLNRRRSSVGNPHSLTEHHGVRPTSAMYRANGSSAPAVGMCSIRLDPVRLHTACICARTSGNWTPRFGTASFGAA